MCWLNFVYIYRVSPVRRVICKRGSSRIFDKYRSKLWNEKIGINKVKLVYNSLVIEILYRYEIRWETSGKKSLIIAAFSRVALNSCVAEVATSGNEHVLLLRVKACPVLFHDDFNRCLGNDQERKASKYCWNAMSRISSIFKRGFCFYTVVILLLRTLLADIRLSFILIDLW